ncbi:MAG: dehydrogenase [Rubrivivax sp.]|jgi:hypothetical protein|nr:dehydrogenase [Rubrivivax sp.]
MNQYMLLLHEKPMDAAQVSPAEMKEIVTRYQAWAGELAQRGLLVGGEKLADEGGRHLRLQAGQALATDGPYAEAHDVVGGYFIVKADGEAAAEALARTCPHLEGTQWIEIRRIEVL